MDCELEKVYKNKISELEKEIRSLRLEYENEHRVQEHMAKQIASQKRIIDKRNAVIKMYVKKYGMLEED